MCGIIRKVILALSYVAITGACHIDSFKDNGKPATISSYALNQSLFGDTGDQDNDGLIDVEENALANGFRPYLIFDSKESARLGFEPLTLFQVRPYDLCNESSLVVLIRWVFLYRWDGGYDSDSWCGDAHGGDNDTATYTLESKDGGITWTIVNIALGRGGISWQSGKPIQVNNNTHPIIYMSAHKHHEYFDTSYNHEDSFYSNWWCNDDVDGNGLRLLVDLDVLERIDPSAGTYNNVGEPHSHSSPPFANRLDAFYVGHSVWGNKKFYEVSPIKTKLMSHAWVGQEQCQCTSGEARIRDCTVNGRAGDRVSTCRRGTWHTGQCTSRDL